MFLGRSCAGIMADIFFFTCNCSQLYTLLIFILLCLCLFPFPVSRFSVRPPPAQKNIDTHIRQLFLCMVCFLSLLHVSFRVPPLSGFETMMWGNASSGFLSSSSLDSPSQISLISSLSRRWLSCLSPLSKPSLHPLRSPSFAPVSALFYYSFHPSLLSSASPVLLFACKEF